MRRASETVEQLIRRAFDDTDENCEVTLEEALHLYAALVAGEAVSDAMSNSGTGEKQESAAALAAQKRYTSGMPEEIRERDNDDGEAGVFETKEAGALAPDTHTHTRRDPLMAKGSCRTSRDAGLRRSGGCSSGWRITESDSAWAPSPS